MSFAENLKQIRKENGISQEELAEPLDVSRQAVSKWEQGVGYPEVEKLLILSRKLNVSLDYLMSTEAEPQKANDSKRGVFSGRILISSPNENLIANVYKVSSSHEFKNVKDAPQYALFGVSGYSFLGEKTEFLGWYATYEDISKEMHDINETLKNGISTYELKYSAKVTKRFLSVKIVKE